MGASGKNFKGKLLVMIDRADPKWLFLSLVPLLFLAIVVGCKKIQMPNFPSLSENCEDLMRRGQEFEEKGYLAKALEIYAAASEKTDAPTCAEAARKKAVEIREILPPDPPKSPPAPLTEPKPPPPEPALPLMPSEIQHTVKRSETLSQIAMYYYDTYMTKVYHEPDSGRYMTLQLMEENYGISNTKKFRVGNVADLLEKINGTKAKDLVVGSRILIPEIEGLPFLHYEEPKVSISSQDDSRRSSVRRPPPRKKPEKSPKSEQPPPPPLEKKPYAIPDAVRKGIQLYHDAEFEKAREILLKTARDGALETRQVSLVYLAMIDIAYGNLQGADGHLRRILVISPDFEIEDIRKFAPGLMDDITPDLRRRFQNIR